MLERAKGPTDEGKFSSEVFQTVWWEVQRAGFAKHLWTTFGKRRIWADCGANRKARGGKKSRFWSKPSVLGPTHRYTHRCREDWTLAHSRKSRRRRRRSRRGRRKTRGRRRYRGGEEGDSRRMGTYICVKFTLWLKANSLFLHNLQIPNFELAK